MASLLQSLGNHRPSTSRRVSKSRDSLGVSKDPLKWDVENIQYVLANGKQSTDPKWQTVSDALIDSMTGVAELGEWSHSRKNYSGMGWNLYESLIDIY